MAQGQTSRQIASELGIAPSTVKTHRRNICGELGLRGPNALMQWAIEKKRQLI
ncbi:response regulator transcription factor [Fodinibius roseus]|uniref:response regulator transcription factor n=1 Tax=Fodinibius roseus TaxID=1194090 RepID=UPI003D9CA307